MPIFFLIFMLKVIPFIYDDYDDLFANTFLIVDKNNNCIAIDPSVNNQKLSLFIKKNSYNLKAIFLTHGHFDHIRGVDILNNYFKTPIYIGFYDEELLIDPNLNCSSLFKNEEIIINSKFETIADNESFHLLNEEMKCIHVPFHTKGSFAFYFKESKILFTGDFLFKGSIGRCDLPTSSKKDFSKSIAKIKNLPNETKIYPGHGGFSTLEIEKNTNQFVK